MIKTLLGSLREYKRGSILTILLSPFWRRPSKFSSRSVWQI